MQLKLGNQNYRFPEDYRNRFQIFYDLMQFRVSEILLVSSLYDDFILEEDGRLTEELTEEFSKLNISSPPPRITRVSSASEALDALNTIDFDLIITMRRLRDMDPFSFGKKIKEKKKDIPVVLLLTNHSDTLYIPSVGEREGIDAVFTWNGDSDLFLAIIKIIEDRYNVDNDTKIGKIRTIIVVEDTIQYYSLFLPIIYKEILKQTQEIIEEGLNLSHRLLRRKGRPKILLAQTFEEAVYLFEKYQDYILGLITDVAFPKEGEKDFTAGEQLIQYIREKKEYLPVLIQSSDPNNYELASEINAKFVHKNSINYLRDFRVFMKQSMLFGDFIFRLPSGEEVARAKNIKHFEEVIKLVPNESIEYHGTHNHFSNWLYSRGEYQLANQLAPYEVDEFDSIDEIREFLLESFEKRRREKQKGIIAEFTIDTFDFTTPFTRIGSGSLGGKGRGIAFISSILSKGELTNSYENVTIRIPETVVLTTDIFDQFIEQNGLYELIKQELSDEDIQEKFLDSSLPEEILNDLKHIIMVSDYPLAVRSSSLLEDSQFHPLAGIYKTYMLSNDQESIDERFRFLTQAIKLVYASAYSKVAKSYIQSMGQKHSVEKMAIIIQRVVGKVHQNRYYPDFSGIVKSYNYYPIRGNPDDGIAEVAVGLGEMVVSGGECLQFSPEFPKVLPQASTVENAVQNTQKEFYAIKLDSKDVNLSDGEFSTLEEYNLEIAKKDGVLDWLASVYDFQNNRIINSVKHEGTLLITFPFILKYEKFPLAEILNDLLNIGTESLGYAVEIEFAVNLDYENEKDHIFYVLQIRPLVINEIDMDDDIEIRSNQGIIKSDMTLGNGIYRDIIDIVYVKPNEFNKTKTTLIRDEISKINQKLKEKGRHYILIGPGRWGTRDKFLGIPAKWNDIDNSIVIIEAALENFQVDPSQGMHFFVNITSTKKGYFTVPFDSEKAVIDWNWIEGKEIVEELKYVRHIQTPPLIIKINGKTGKGIILEQNSS